MRLDKKILKEIAEFMTKGGHHHSNTKNSPKVYRINKSKKYVVMRDRAYTDILMYSKTDVVNFIYSQDFIPMMSVDHFMIINKFSNDKEFIELSK